MWALALPEILMDVSCSVCYKLSATDRGIAVERELVMLNWKSGCAALIRRRSKSKCDLPLFEALEDRRFLSATPQILLVHGMTAVDKPSTSASLAGLRNGPTHERKFARPASKSASADVFSTVTGAKTPANFFMIGVWSQPPSMMRHWKSFGVNTLVGYESQGGTISLNRWKRAAASNGFFTIRPPGTNPAQDNGDKKLLAWMLPDEPDYRGTDPPILASLYANLKSVNPRLPIFVNYAGGKVIGWLGPVSQADYNDYLAATDWVGNDIYPVTGWNQPQSLDASAQVATRLSAWSGGKPQIAVIETSNQLLPYVPAGTPGVTAGQFRAEVWATINHGATGIVYFPQQIGNGFHYDATPPSVSKQMKLENARLQSLGAVLQSTFNPDGFGLNLDPSLQGSWRSYGGKNYFIVSNATGSTIASAGIGLNGVTSGPVSASVAGENRSVPLQNGTLTDSFTAYETHVYVVNS